MALDTPAKRLQWARKQHGKYKTPTEAAKAFGWPVSTYLGHENNDRNPSRSAAKRYAKQYRVRWEWLLEGEGEPKSAAAAAVLAYVPLIDLVTAGKLASPLSQLPVEDVPLLAFADLGSGDFFALRVQGDSMDRLAPDGAVIIVNRADRVLVPGKSYVFSVRGETTFKMWHADPPYLAPYSHSPHEPIFIKRRSDLEVIGRVRRSVLDL